jgi:hypothetical protein
MTRETELPLRYKMMALLISEWINRTKMHDTMSLKIDRGNYFSSN